MIEPNNIYLGDCYELIKQIPDKSIDLIYTDIPYLYEEGGVGYGDVQTRKARNNIRLKMATTKYDHCDNDEVREALRINKGVMASRTNIVSLSDGIDYKIFDEMCRVLKYIYIYMVFQVADAGHNAILSGEGMPNESACMVQDQSHPHYEECMAE